MAAEVRLQVIGEKALHQPANPSLLAYSPSMELLAQGSTDDQVLIYRLNGQRVYGATLKGSKLQVNKIGWKSDGQLLAIAWSDGIVRLIGAESSKTVHQITATDQDGVEITCLGWASNFIRRRSTKAPRKGPKSWKELLEKQQGSEHAEPSLDLPRDLALIDIESSMPHLSTLPAGATSDDIFSSRASLDGIFRLFDPKDNEKVDIMVVGLTDGRVHLSIYDSFVIGSFPSPMPSSRATTHQMILHASHKYYSSHALLMKSASTLVRGLHFVPMDVRFVSTSSEHLSILASRSTTLHNLLRYIHQVQDLMATEWQATQDLPSRFLRNINETLTEQNNCDIVTAMYHSVVTGDTFPAVKEWLVDELAERGHKRWDKAVTTGLESLRRLIHEHMQPALERCGVILSRLLGIAKFQAVEDSTGFSPRQISLVMDTVACLNLVSMRILMYVVEEIDLFTAFSVWLRFEIDRLASDSSTDPSEEQAEKEAAIDHAKVLQYIQTCLTRSRLAAFFQGESTEKKEEVEDITSKNDDSEHKGLPLFDLVDAQLKKHDNGLAYDRSLTNVKDLVELMDRQAEEVFQGIAEAEKRNVLFGQPVSLGVEGEVTAVDMRMCAEDESHCSTYIAIAEGTQVRLFHIVLRLNNGVSTRISSTMAHVSLNGDTSSSTKILDVAFLDDSSLLILSSETAGANQASTASTSASTTPKSILRGIRFREVGGGPGLSSSLIYTHFYPSQSSTTLESQQAQDISSLQATRYILPHGNSTSGKDREEEQGETSKKVMDTTEVVGGGSAEKKPEEVEAEVDDSFIPAKMTIRKLDYCVSHAGAATAKATANIRDSNRDKVRIFLLDAEGVRYRVLGIAGCSGFDGHRHGNGNAGNARQPLGEIYEDGSREEEMVEVDEEGDGEEEKQVEEEDEFGEEDEEEDVSMS